MNIDTQAVEPCQMKLTVEIDAERLQRAKQAAARKLSGRLNIPGFRKGKAPYAVVVNQVGEAAVTEQAVDALGSEIYKEALELTNIEPSATGELVEIAHDPLKFTFVVPLLPQVELGPYRSVRVQFEPAQVQDEALTAALERLRAGHALLEPVERAAMLGDVATLDFSGVLTDALPEREAQLFNAKDQQALLETTEDYPMPGFANAVVGISAGETRNFELAFPADYSDEGLRSKSVQCEVTCRGLKSRTLPALDNDFAALVDAKYETLLDLRVALRTELQRQAEAEASNVYQRQVLDAVLAGASVQFPPAMVREEVEDLAKSRDSYLRSMGITLPDYLKTVKKDPAEFMKELEPEAQERLRRSLLLGQVVKTEKLAVDAAGIDARIERMAVGYGESAARVRPILGSERGRARIERDLLGEQALELLVSIAKGESLLPAAEIAQESGAAALVGGTPGAG
ncbi:MAG: trigger factor [Chloroflexi bacterium]|nr:MAG: trigger factor [Chloroflexota bacterium]